MEDLKPNTTYINPNNQNQYTLKQQNPDKSVTVINKANNQEEIIPSTVMMNADPTSFPLKPVVQNNPNQQMMAQTTTSNMRQSMANEIDKLVKNDDTDSMVETVSQHLMEDIQNSVESIVEDATLIGKLSPKEDTQEPLINDIDSVMGDTEGEAHSDNKVDDKADDKVDDKPDNKEKELPKASKNLGSFKKPIQPKVVVAKRWDAIRAEITTKEQDAFAKRQAQHAQKAQNVGFIIKEAKDIGFSPDKREAGPSGHATVNNIPMTINPSEKDKVIGLTEFPKDHKRDDDFFANTTMKEMDEAQVANREKFDNEGRMFMRNMTIRQYRALHSGDKEELESVEENRGINNPRGYVKPEKSEQYDHKDVEKKAIAQSLGLTSFSDVTGPELPSEASDIGTGPIQHKQLKTAPKNNAYTEPALVDPASGKVKEGLNKLHQATIHLSELKEKMKQELDPLEKQINEVRQKYTPDMNKDNALVKSYVEMVYNHLGQTVNGIVHWGGKVWAHVRNFETIKPAVTVPQVLVQLDKTNELAAKIVRDIVAVLESEQGGTVVNRTLYEFPPSKDLQTRLKPEASLILHIASESLVHRLAQILLDLATLDAELEVPVNME